MSNESIHLTVNGAQQELNVRQLSLALPDLGFEEDFFAVALNGTFIPRSLYEKTFLQEGDELEVLIPMQGG